MKKIVRLIFLILSLVTVNEILAEGMTLKKQGAGSLPTNRVLTQGDFNSFPQVSEVFTNQVIQDLINPMKYLVSGACALSGNQIITGTSAGTCTITVTLGSLTKTSDILVRLRPQIITVTASPSTISTSGTTTLSTTGNQGAVTYSVTSGSCTISGSTVTAGTSGGTCSITATAAAVTGYSAGIATTSITVNDLPSQNLVITSDKSSLKIQRSGSCSSPEKATLTTTGVMCASPSVTYSTSTPGTCDVSGNSVTILSTTGSCVITASQPACTGYKAGTASLSIPAGGNVTPSINISASPLTGNAGSKANATVTVNYGIPPYRISCSTSDYRANCNMTSNDGTNTITTGAGSGAAAKISPVINGGSGNTFNVQAWALFTRAQIGATGYSGTANFKVYDSGCYNGTPFGVTPQVYAPN